MTWPGKNFGEHDIQLYAVAIWITLPAALLWPFQSLVAPQCAAPRALHVWITLTFALAALYFGFVASRVEHWADPTPSDIVDTLP